MLIEHFAGAFPLWLSPEQIRVLPLSDKTLDYAYAVAKQLEEAGLKATVDSRDGKVQAKIRDAQLDLINYMAVVGPREAVSLYPSSFSTSVERAIYRQPMSGSKSSKGDRDTAFAAKTGDRDTAFAAKGVYLNRKDQDQHRDPAYNRGLRTLVLGCTLNDSRMPLATVPAHCICHRSFPGGEKRYAVFAIKMG